MISVKSLMPLAVIPMVLLIFALIYNNMSQNSLTMLAETVTNDSIGEGVGNAVLTSTYLAKPNTTAGGLIVYNETATATNYTYRYLPGGK